MLMPRFSAISLFIIPEAIRRSTSVSRWLSSVGESVGLAWLSANNSFRESISRLSLWLLQICCIFCEKDDLSVIIITFCFLGKK